MFVCMYAWNEFIDYSTLILQYIAYMVINLGQGYLVSLRYFSKGWFFFFNLKEDSLIIYDVLF